MRVTMTEQRDVAPDGMHVVTLDAGDSVELPDDLAARLVARGLAVADGERAATRAKPATERPAKPSGRSRKAKGDAPENGSAGDAPETKAVGG